MRCFLTVLLVCLSASAQEECPACVCTGEVEAATNTLQDVVDMKEQDLASCNEKVSIL